MTTYTIDGMLVGTFWWPYGEQWTKPIDLTFTPEDAQDLERLRDFGSSRPQRLRSILEAVTDDGDSATAPVLSADSLLIVRREKITRSGRIVHERAVPLRSMRSAVIYLEQED